MYSKCFHLIKKSSALTIPWRFKLRRSTLHGCQSKEIYIYFQRVWKDITSWRVSFAENTFLILQGTGFLFCWRHVFYFAGSTFFILQETCFLFCREHIFHFAGNMFFILQETSFLFRREHVFYFAGNMLFILQGTHFSFCRKHVFYFAGNKFFISQGARFLFCRKHAFYFAGSRYLKILSGVYSVNFANFAWFGQFCEN